MGLYPTTFARANTVRAITDADRGRCEQACRDVGLPLDRWRDAVLDYHLYWDGNILRPSDEADSAFIQKAKARIEIEIGMWVTVAEGEQWSGIRLVDGRRQLPDGQIIDGMILVIRAGAWAITKNIVDLDTDIHSVLVWRPDLGGMEVGIAQLGKVVGERGERSDNAVLDTLHALQELQGVLTRSRGGRPKKWDGVEDFTADLDKAIGKLRRDGRKVVLAQLAQEMNASEETISNYCADNGIDWQARAVNLGGLVRKKRQR